MGIEYQDLTSSLRSNHNIPDEVQGVWVTSVAADSPLFDKNVRDNDFIVEVNGTAVESSSDLEAAVEAVESGDLLRFYINRYDMRSGNSASFFAIVRKP